MKKIFNRSLTSHQAKAIMALLKCLKKLNVKLHSRFQFLQQGMTDPGSLTSYKVIIDDIS